MHEKEKWFNCRISKRLRVKNTILVKSPLRVSSLHVLNTYPYNVSNKGHGRHAKNREKTQTSRNGTNNLT